MSDKPQEDEPKTTGQSSQEPVEGAVEPGNETQPPQGQSSEQDTTG